MSNIFCSNCGSLNNRDSNFCSNCGCSLKNIKIIGVNKSNSQSLILANKYGVKVVLIIISIGFLIYVFKGDESSYERPIEVLGESCYMKRLIINVKDSQKKGFSELKDNVSNAYKDSLNANGYSMDKEQEIPGKYTDRQWDSIMWKTYVFYRANGTSIRSGEGKDHRLRWIRPAGRDYHINDNPTTYRLWKILEQNQRGN
jgi:RNA polymerase subunit RPABC4/transcription elongation factor Spt4